MSDADMVKVVCPHCRIIADKYREGFCNFCSSLRVKSGTLAPGERSRIFREELDKVLDGFDYDAFRRLDRAIEAIQVDDDEDDVTDQACTALRAALLPPEGGV